MARRQHTPPAAAAGANASIVIRAGAVKTRIYRGKVLRAREEGLFALEAKEGDCVMRERAAAHC